HSPHEPDSAVANERVARGNGPAIERTTPDCRWSIPLLPALEFHASALPTWRPRYGWSGRILSTRGSDQRDSRDPTASQRSRSSPHRATLCTNLPDEPAVLRV